MRILEIDSSAKCVTNEGQDHIRDHGVRPTGHDHDETALTRWGVEDERLELMGGASIIDYES